MTHHASRAAGAACRQTLRPPASALLTGEVASSSSATANTWRSLTGGSSPPSLPSSSNEWTTRVAAQHCTQWQLSQTVPHALRTLSLLLSPLTSCAHALAPRPRPPPAPRGLLSAGFSTSPRGGSSGGEGSTHHRGVSSDSTPSGDASGQARSPYEGRPGHPYEGPGRDAIPASSRPVCGEAAATSSTSSPSAPASSPQLGGSQPTGSLLVVRGVAVQSALDRASSALLAHAVDLGIKLNQLTGYNVIEQLKTKVDEADQGLACAREELRAGKLLYEARVAEHGEVQRQLMGLLQRKGSWVGADVERFAQLCRDEHGLEGGVAQAKAAYGAAAEALEGAHGQLLRAIRERYSAETLWSDKIRRASTWWTAGLMAVHLASFMSVYLVMEPIKARRLRNHVEDVLRLELTSVRQTVASLQASLESHVADLGAPAAAVGVAGGGDEGAAAVAAGTSGVGGAEAALLAELLPELGQVRRQLAAVEKRVAAVSGRQPSQAAPLGAWGSAPREGPPQAHAAALPMGDENEDSGVSVSGVTEGTSDESVAGPTGLKGRVVRWLVWVRHQLHRAASTPEVTTGAASFAGAVLGFGVLLVLRERR